MRSTHLPSATEMQAQGVGWLAGAPQAMEANQVLEQVTVNWVDAGMKPWLWYIQLLFHCPH